MGLGYHWCYLAHLGEPKSALACKEEREEKQVCYQ